MANQWLSDIRRNDVRDARHHHRRTHGRVTHFGREQFGSVYENDVVTGGWCGLGDYCQYSDHVVITYWNKPSIDSDNEVLFDITDVGRMEAWVKLELYS